MMKRTKKPAFHRQHSHAKKKVGSRWRRPRGIYSKQREKKKSRGARPGPGYRRPRKKRGCHPSGLREVIIHNPIELEGLDPKTHCVRIGATVGVIKRITIMETAQAKNIKVLNKKKLSLKKKKTKTETPKSGKETAKETKAKK
jgi:large subunit ribosomal protein L32e